MDRRNEEPFVCLNYFRTVFSGRYPLKSTQKSPDAEIPAKWTKWHNFQTVQDKHKMSEYKIGVAFSESANIYHLQRPQAENTSCRHSG